MQSVGIKASPPVGSATQSGGRDHSGAGGQAKATLQKSQRQRQ